ncbi:hypothetical protein, partial [Fulvivirga aurantia]|uniref:hypothetical protein n=1 Tax=Fulvivirga aurantia TaxID=2529383 RepID=UPI001628ED36
LESDNRRNIYISGRYKGEMRFGDSYFGKTDGSGGFVVKINSERSIYWHYTRPNNEIRDIAVDANEQVTLLSGNKLVRLSSTGDLKWEKNIPLFSAYMDTDQVGNVYLAGFKDPNKSGNPPSDITLMKLNQEAEIIWE